MSLSTESSSLHPDIQITHGNDSHRSADGKTVDFPLELGTWTLVISHLTPIEGTPRSSAGPTAISTVGIKVVQTECPESGAPIRLQPTPLVNLPTFNRNSILDAFAKLSDIESQMSGFPARRMKIPMISSTDDWERYLIPDTVKDLEKQQFRCFVAETHNIVSGVLHSCLNFEEVRLGRLALVKMGEGALSEEEFVERAGVDKEMISGLRDGSYRKLLFDSPDTDICRRLAGFVGNLSRAEGGTDAGVAQAKEMWLGMQEFMERQKDVAAELGFDASSWHIHHLPPGRMEQWIKAVSNAERAVAGYDELSMKPSQETLTE